MAFNAESSRLAVLTDQQNELWTYGWTVVLAHGASHCCFARERRSKDGRRKS
jgi:hypothetical protein